MADQNSPRGFGALLLVDSGPVGGVDADGSAAPLPWCWLLADCLAALVDLVADCDCRNCSGKTRRRGGDQRSWPVPRIWRRSFLPCWRHSGGVWWMDLHTCGFCSLDAGLDPRRLISLACSSPSEARPCSWPCWPTASLLLWIRAVGSGLAARC